MWNYINWNLGNYNWVTFPQTVWSNTNTNKTCGLISGHIHKLMNVGWGESWLKHCGYSADHISGLTSSWGNAVLCCVLDGNWNFFRFLAFTNSCSEPELGMPNWTRSVFRVKWYVAPTSNISFIPSQSWTFLGIMVSWTIKIWRWQGVFCFFICSLRCILLTEVITYTGTFRFFQKEIQVPMCCDVTRNTLQSHIIMFEA